MATVWDWLKARLNEGTTWAGLGVAAIAVGAALDSGLGWKAALVAGAVAIIKKDSK